MLGFLVNPNKFNRFADFVLKPLSLLSLIVLLVGLILIYFSPDEVGLGKREKVSDVAKVISKMSDIAILRTYHHSTIEEFAKYSTIDCRFYNFL